jgi:glucose-1-phosphate cytidylyltransferase
MIKDYFANYHLHSADVTYDLAAQQTTFHRNDAEPWRVTCIDTGEKTMTGGRIKRAIPYLDGESFCMTYGDGVTDSDIGASIAWHRSHGCLATVTAVQSPGRFGAFRLQSGSDRVGAFHEKPRGDGAWINGGFFVLEPEVADYIADDLSVWEHEPMQQLAIDGQLQAWRHDGFWQSMDTLRDRMVLEELDSSGHAPWKSWDKSISGGASITLK